MLGKNFIDPSHRLALDNGLSYSLYRLAGPDEKENIRRKVAAFEDLKGRVENITEPVYVEARQELISMASNILGLSENDVRSRLIPVEHDYVGVCTICSKQTQ